MATDSAPLIALEEGGTAPVISYNVPEPTRYSGRNFIELLFPDSYYTAEAKEVPSEEQTDGAGAVAGPWVGLGGALFVPNDSGGTTGTPIDPGGPGTGPGLVPGIDLEPVEPEVPEAEELEPIQVKVARTSRSLRSGDAIPGSRNILMALRNRRNSISWVKKADGTVEVTSTMPITSRVAELTPIQVKAVQAQGEKPVFYQTMYGETDVALIPTPTTATPRILLVETYRLSSYLGAYGAGRTTRTFSLLPGESTTISVRTFRKTEEDYASSSSILDSFTSESSTEFESSLQSEQTSTESADKSFEYHAEAEAKVSWGWGSAEVSGGVSGSSNSTREEFAKNVSSATEKSAMSASAKREVQVETSYEVKTTEEEETSIVREIKNINVSRTLNFVFRQMNQEFITLLHLVDVRVAFFNGYNESKREVTLPELDSLLEEYIVSDHRSEVRQQIIDELSHIFDYRGEHHSFVEERRLEDPSGVDLVTYLRAKVETTSTYKNEATGTEIVVPGIILSANTNVLRTEGVIVEALLGQGDAMDEYSHGLQDESVRSKQLENDLAEAEVNKLKLGVSIVEAGDSAKAALFASVFSTAVEEDSADE
jgi:hypothetical protein